MSFAVLHAGAPGYYIIHILQLLASLGTLISIQLAMAFTMKVKTYTFNLPWLYH